MKDPFEFLAKDYLPWMKGLVSIDLSQRGYSQSKISTMLGVTQPSINYYLRKEKKEYLSRLQRIGLTEQSIKEQEGEFREAVVAGGSEGMLRTMQVMLNALASGELCNYHKKVYRAPSDCDACMRLWGSGDQKERSRIVSSLNRAVSVLESSSTFPLLIPEVNTNFVLAARDARSEKDVAGIEGRIVKLRGMARAMSGAEFGGSGHLASVLLAVKKFFPKINSAMNIRYDRAIHEILTSLHWKLLELPASEPLTSEQIPHLVEERLSEMCRNGKITSLDAVTHAGSIGIEPSTYIFGADTEEVLRKVLDLAAAYASRRTETVHNRH
ncbi:MAG: thiamine-phosphate synthase family protein [Conexivisphaerales archaeon]